MFSESDFKWLPQGLRVGIERLDVLQPIRLRSETLDNLSAEAVKKMLQKYDFFDTTRYWMGKEVQQEYEVITQQ